MTGGRLPMAQNFTGDICTDAYNLGCEGLAVFRDRGRQRHSAKTCVKGQSLLVQARGKDTCGEEYADGIDAAVCSDPAAARNGDLTNCTWDISMSQLNREQFGPDRFGGTITKFDPQ